MKTTEVVHWPPVLVISFKRFEFDSATRRHQKITRHIDFPMLLRDGVTYNLRSVIEHQGVFGGGHYVAYVRAHSEQWYHCNDIMNPQIIEDPTTVLQHQAYMLIYERT